MRTLLMSLFLNANMRAVSDVKEHEAADQQVQQNSSPTVSSISTADDKTEMLSESPGKHVFFTSFPPSEMLIGFLQMHLLNIKLFMIVNR